MVYASIRTCYDVELKDWVKSLTGDAPSLHYIKMAIPCAMNPNNVRFADYNVDLRIFISNEIKKNKTSQRFSRQRSKCQYITRRAICPVCFGTSIEAGKSVKIGVNMFQEASKYHNLKIEFGMEL
ncbi:hypothetical protein RIR_jg20645.t1 [Rhizophagus irregularis DAOM 181602=DAOM 197198]|nr:hypothetical protein RIR_jg20645.t1 [Rhizophagus irregularis DAOM 181602=DAOM 197198]